MDAAAIDEDGDQLTFEFADSPAAISGRCEECVGRGMKDGGTTVYVYDVPTQGRCRPYQLELRFEDQTGTLLSFRIRPKPFH